MIAYSFRVIRVFCGAYLKLSSYDRTFVSQGCSDAVQLPVDHRQSNPFGARRQPMNLYSCRRSRGFLAGALSSSKWSGGQKQNEEDYPAASMNSSTVKPALEIRLRSVPRATSGWSGIDNVAMCPSLVKMMWLPFDERLANQAFQKS